MKISKNILLSFTILVLSVSTAFAQRAGGGGGGGSPRGDRSSLAGARPQATPEQRQQRADKFAEKLGLSDTQKAQIADLRKQQGDALKAVRDDSTLTKEQKKAKIKELDQSYREQNKAVLTPEQQAKAAEFRSHQREKRDEKPATPPTGG